MQRKIPDGMKVRITHYRVTTNGRVVSPRAIRTEGLRVMPKGGETVAEIIREALDSNGDPQVVVITAAKAQCSALDAYDKRKGRLIAVGRALAQLDGTTAQRNRRREAESFTHVVESTYSLKP